jgi:HEAT repeat protein
MPSNAPPQRTRSTRSVSASFLCALCILRAGSFCAAQEPPAPQAVSQASLQAAIDNLGKLDYSTRTTASRTIRRTPASQAVPALVQAVRTNDDGYVKYRALVLLTGFNHPGTDALMREAMTSVNDRLRTVAYEYFEHHPDRSMAAQLLASLDKEDAEFVRPALIRALAALGDDSRVASVLVREAGRGEDVFRSAVIEALGDYKAAYAIEALTALAGQDGPLLDDAALALGKIGDPRAIGALAGLQSSPTKAVLPTVAASICLLGVQCLEQERYLVDTLKTSGENGPPQEVVRAAVAGLGALALAGRSSAAEALIEVGVHAPDPVRAPIALAVATIALRNTPLAFALVEKAQQSGAFALVAEGFDMLEEDFDKERFFALARKTYWSAPDGSPTRSLMQTLIETLEF